MKKRSAGRQRPRSLRSSYRFPSRPVDPWHLRYPPPPDVLAFASGHLFASSILRGRLHAIGDSGSAIQNVAGRRASGSNDGGSTTRSSPRNRSDVQTSAIGRTTPTGLRRFTRGDGPIRSFGESVESRRKIPSSSVSEERASASSGFSTHRPTGIESSQRSTSRARTAESSRRLRSTTFDL